MVAAGKMGDEANKIPLASETWTKEVKEELLKLLAVEKERVKVMEEERRERQENRKTSIDPTCPKYSGRFDEDVDMWIFRVTHAMAMQKVPEKEQLSALLSYTDGAATSNLRAYMQTTDCTLGGFFEKVQSSSKNKWKKVKVVDELYAARQGANYDAFENKFQNLAVISGLKDCCLSLMFKRALNSNTRRAVEEGDPKSIEDCYKLAEGYEACNKVVTNREAALLTKYNYRNIKPQGRFATNSSQRDGDKDQKQRENQRFEGECYNCGLKGHRKVDCTRKKKQSKEGQEKRKAKAYKTEVEGSESEEEEKATAHYAKVFMTKVVVQEEEPSQEGYNQTLAESVRAEEVLEKLLNEEGQSSQTKEHEKVQLGVLYYDVKVYKTDEFDDGKLFIIVCKINGYTLSNTIIDPGSSMSIMSLSVARENNIKILPFKCSVSVADDRTIAVEGITEKLKVQVKNKICYLKFLVLKANAYEILLGCNFFKETGCIIDVKNQKFWFPEEILGFEENREELFSNLAIGKEDIDDEDCEGINWEPDKKLIKSEVELKNREKEHFNELVPLIKKVSASNYLELNGGCKIGEFDLKLKEGKMSFRKSYNKSEFEIQELKKVANELLEAGIIRYSNSHYSSPFFLHKHPITGKFRPVIDYKELNKNTVREDWPIPKIDDLLFKLKKAKIFSKADCKSGYFMIRVKETAKKYLAFSDGERNLEWNFMPMGIMNAPMVFTRVMHEILGDLNFVFVYIDDICIFSETVREHMKHVEIVLVRLKNANMKLNPDKCVWFSNSIKLLGHVISDKGIAPDEDKTESIKERKHPTNVKELQSFLGICNYYRKFIKNFADIAAPLYKLIRNEVVWEFKEEQIQAFKTLKEKLCTYPVLRQPNMKKTFKLYCDASHIAVGVVLSQADEENNEYVIAYASRLFKGFEINWCISDKEMFACIYGVKEFKQFIFGTRFIIVTDHSALMYLLNLKDPTGRLARWSMFLSQFDYEIEYRKGTTHQNADYISRPVLLTRTRNQEEEENSTRNLDPFLDESLLHYLKYKKHKNGISKKQVRRIENAITKYEYSNDTLYVIKKNKKMIIPKIEDRESIIIDNHDQVAHFGKATYERIREKYFWPKMFNQIEKHNKQCLTCVRNMNHTVSNHPAFSNAVSLITDEISIDFVWGLDVTKKGYTGVMVIMNTLSKYVRIFKLRTKDTEEVGKKLTKYFCNYGPTMRILSDNEPGLIAAVKEMKNRMGIEWHKTVAAYSPQHNGLIEKFVHTFGTTLRKLAEKDRINWPNWLPFIELAYNTRIHSTTKLTPFELTFGIICRHFEDWGKECEDNSLDNKLLIRSSQIKNSNEIVRNKAKENIEIAQEVQKDTSNKNNKKILRTFLKNNTVVYRKNEGMITKLEPRWLGPYKIFDHDLKGNYLLTESDGTSHPKRYPLEKLFVVDRKIEENLKQIKRILKHKNEKNEIKYLVEWKENKEQEWVEEKNFETIDIINDYWKSIAGEKRGRGRPPIYHTNTLFLFLVLITGIEMVIGQEKIQLCNGIKKMKALNIDEICKTKKEADIEKITWINKDIIILEKLHNKIDGEGFKCKIEIKTKNCTMGFFGSEYCIKDEEWKSYKISDYECWRMIRTKECEIKNNELYFNKKMECINKTCFLEFISPDKFNYMVTNQINSYRCEIKRVSIVAENEEANIHVGNSCKVKDYECRSGNELIVWNKTVIHECPYEIIPYEGEFELKESILLNNKTNELLSLQKRSGGCEKIEMIKTDEGYYLTSKDNLKQLTKMGVKEIAKANIDTINEYMFSTIDYNRNEIKEIKNEINMQNCLNLQNILRTFSKLENVFTIIKRINGEEIVVFTHGGINFIPECMEIVNVKIRTGDVEECYKELETEFTWGEKNIIGFMDNNKVISMAGNKINCKIKSKTIILKNKKMYQRIGKRVIEKELDIYEWVDGGIFNKKKIKLNTYHPKRIMAGIDIEDILISFYEEDELGLEENFGEFKVEKQQYYESGFSKIMRIIEGPFENLGVKINELLLIVTIGLILIIIGYIIYKQRKVIMEKCRTRTRKDQKKYEPEPKEEIDNSINLVRRRRISNSSESITSDKSTNNNEKINKHEENIINETIVNNDSKEEHKEGTYDKIVGIYKNVIKDKQ